MTASLVPPKRDLERIAEMLKGLGMEIARVEIERGKVTLYAGKPGEEPKAIPKDYWKTAHL